MHQHLNPEVLAALEGNDGSEEGEVDEVEARELLGPWDSRVKRVPADDLQQCQEHHEHHEERCNGLKNHFYAFLERHSAPF